MSVLDLRPFYASADKEVPVTLPCGVDVVVRPLSPEARADAIAQAGPMPMYGRRVNATVQASAVEVVANYPHADPPDYGEAVENGVETMAPFDILTTLEPGTNT